MYVTQPQPRGSFDLFGPVHKGLRMAHANLMIRLGAAELEDDRVLSGLLEHLREHLRLCQEYQGYEEKVIHAALSPHAPGAVQDLDRAHQSHRAILEDVEALARALELRRRPVDAGRRAPSISPIRGSSPPISTIWPRMRTRPCLCCRRCSTTTN
ncbi:MAG: hypothetical protein V4466_14385 [Pseudomonadota bacterium]